MRKAFDVIAKQFKNHKKEYGRQSMKIQKSNCVHMITLY